MHLIQSYQVIKFWDWQSFKSSIKAQKTQIKSHKAADCLYPDVSSWPDFFCTVSFILRSNPSCFLLLAFHKRNNFLSIEPFLEFFNLESEEIPLRDFELDSESNIGETNLPGPNTGSIQLFKVFKKDFELFPENQF